MSFRDFETFSASSGCAASAVGPAAARASQDGLHAVETATTVSMMSNTGISGVSARLDGLHQVELLDAHAARQRDDRRIAELRISEADREGRDVSFRWGGDGRTTRPPMVICVPSMLMAPTARSVSAVVACSVTVFSSASNDEVVAGLLVE